MMTGQGRSRRRRSRRGGQRPPQDAVQQVDGAADVTVPRESEPEPSPERESRPEREQRPEREARSRPAGDDQAPGREGGRKRSRNRRRTTRRPVLGPMPMEVLKDSARPVAAAEPTASRTLDEFSTPGGLTFGCPMLTRTRVGMPFAGGHHVPRCAMGWAIHGESEALLCMRTPDMLDCWKEHPEKEAELRATESAENAAD